MQNVASELRAWRKLQGYSLVQLAERTGLSVSFLSDIERGKTEPSLATLRRIATAYDRALVVAFVLRGIDERDTTDTR